MRIEWREKVLIDRVSSSELLQLSFLIFAISFAFFCPEACATYLTINGTTQVEVTVNGDSAHLHANCEIENDGDETADGVFPALQLMSWVWAGEPRRMAVKERQSWSIDETIPLAKLSCAGAASCAGLALPQEGSLPLIVTRNYQDTNGYKFSAIEVKTVLVGKPTGEALVATKGQSLIAKLEMNGDGQDFEGTLTIHNTSDAPKKVAVVFVTSREVQVLTEPKVISIDPRGLAAASVELKNFTALARSTYPVSAIMQWEENGVRATSTTVTSIRIDSPDSRPLIIKAAAGAVIGSILLMFFLILRSRRPEVPRGKDS